MASAITRRIEKLEQRVSVDDRPIEIIVLSPGDPDPILDDSKDWIIVRGVAPSPRIVES